jgi:RNA polymerase sigma-70 factor (ECF subfamily)
MTEPADADLVAACLDGRQDAFAELVRRHQDSVFGLAMIMTRNRADAADMAQEAFIKAYRNLAQYKPQYAFRNWVMGICANQTKNRFRTRTRRRRAEEKHLQLQPPSAHHSDARLADMEEMMHLIPDRLRVPLLLRYVEGLSYDEISAVLHIGVSAAKMRVKRARDDLALRLESREGVAP